MYLEYDLVHLQISVFKASGLGTLLEDMGFVWKPLRQEYVKNCDSEQDLRTLVNRLVTDHKAQLMTHT